MRKLKKTYSKVSWHLGWLHMGRLNIWRIGWRIRCNMESR